MAVGLGGLRAMAGRRGMAAALVLALVGALAASPRPARAAGEGLRIDAHTSTPLRLEAPAERVVSLVHAVTETLLVLERPPVGVAQPEQYARYVGIETAALADSTPVGRRQEPSLERIAALEPDLIVGASFRHAAIADRLAEIAPTLLLTFYPSNGGGDGGDRLAHVQEVTRTLARAVGRSAAAQALIRDLDATLAAQRRRLAEAGLAGARVFVSSTLPGAQRYRIFTRNAMAARILERLGLAYAWDAPPERYGFDTVGLTRLAGTGDAHGLMVTHADTPPWVEGPRTAAWQAVPAVRAGRMHRLSRDTAPFGGVATAQRFAVRAADALLSGQVSQSSQSADR
jgi:iron complex transport system substrate-binding protein